MLFIVALVLCSAVGGTLLFAPAAAREQNFYLGFDRNDYPGDDALPQLRKSFNYTGYWLNLPPGAKLNSWTGKRALLAKRGFGFLLLFNGKLYRELQAAGDAAAIGRQDAVAAAASAQREGFKRGAVIFLDQEEGGVLLPEQFAYIEAWSDAVRITGYMPGVYCSGLAISTVRRDSPSVTTAADLRAKLGNKQVKLWVANDQCPPSPGCSYGRPLPAPWASGEADALVWQFAQSPRRKQFTQACASSYAADGMCYAPGMPQGENSFVDLNTSTELDPSHGR